MAAIACHNAYRIGDELNRSEMRELVDTLYEMTGAYNCPHSRPILIMLGNASSFTKPVT
jgi:DNA mismatch repair ATPase MutL